ncbi:lipid-binding SYLF domain-containing protein [Lysobacter sp. M15]|uniref:lipid-binding SYLF domain-containing protein n=1 Tax=Lysobacter sp. M15 TaxID=2916837 RepID=UPI001F58074D|nr:lipid-binding SYLF domain-containing protein [Lysobacter sp. M15]
MPGLPRARRPLFRAVVCACLIGASALAWAGRDEDARAQNAIRVMTDIQAIPESAIPDKLLDEAKAIVVVPDTIKAGLVFGGRRGHGLMSVKTPEGTWSNPVFVKLTGGSIGLQAGVQSSDVVLAFRSDRGLESIVNGKFTLGADAGVAAGPMGRNAATATDGEFKAEIWSWSRARGLFAGVALDGAVLSIDDAANEAVYGRDTTPRMVFEGRTQGQPSSAVVDFRDLLEEATATARARRGTEGVIAQGRAPGSAASVPPAAASPAQAQGTVEGAAETSPQPFETVDNPAQVETLPATP